MKRAKQIISAVMGMALALLLFMGHTTPVLAVNTNDANKMNVVFVLDESGSMSKTDPGALRYEAVDLFLGIATDTGNYMGAVVFDDDIVLQQDIQEIDGKAAKNELSQSIRNADSYGDTDIGKAIELATQMLVENGNSNLPSVMILLSDGNTDLPKDKTGKAVKASLASKETAINTARSNGIKIHSICLNSNGAANPEELREISDATGGTCVEVKSAEDLKDVFNNFYDIIYSTATINLANTTIPKSGELVIPFEIPMIGVEEANIIINTLNEKTTYNLTNPSGYGLTQAELNEIEIKAKTFTILKIEEPEDGQWKLIVRGVPGDQVVVNMVYNSDLSLDISAGSVNSGIMVGEEIQITAQLFNGSTVISDTEVYQTYPITLSAVNSDTGSMAEEEMSPDGDHDTFLLKLQEYSDYEVQAYCEIDNMIVKSNTIILSAGNSTPVSSESLITVSKLVTPFTGDLYVEDLSRIISDAEDTELIYTIRMSDFEPDMVYLDKSELKIRIRECGSGYLKIAAADSRGAEVSVGVQIKTYSLIKILACILLPVLLIVAILIIWHVLREGNRVIRGRIQISAYNEDGYLGAPETFDGGRGKMFLVRYLDLREDIGIDLSQTYFKAGEKDSFIYLISKKGCFTDMEPDKRNKKIRLSGEMETDICSDNEFTKGIKVTYIPEDMEY